MEFGYFTLSDNHYEGNTRDANTFVQDLTNEALYADQLGMYSAWIGEHHFNSLGVNSSPEMVLAYIAARTKHIRLAPAVTVLPLHNPIRVAEQWATLDLLSGGRVDFAAGRGYDRREYIPFGVSFDDNQSIFDEGMEVLRNLWSSGGKRIDHKGKHYQFEDVRITPQPLQNPMPMYVASFSKPSIELAARLNCGPIVAPFAAAMSFGGLKRQVRYQAAPPDVQLFHALRRQRRRGEGAASPPDPLLQGMRDPLLPRRSENRAPELPLFHRHGAAPAQREAGRPDREFGADRQFGAHHRNSQKSRGRGLRRGDPVFQCRHEAASADQGRDGPLHEGSCSAFRGQAQAARRLISAASSLTSSPASASHWRAFLLSQVERR
jgi:alkanesulfonate monooxygenase SsuD/methylene tetrahydromethanopterin reductase-like flavin-dependent oxidoreductase (luciferase family)